MQNFNLALHIEKSRIKQCIHSNWMLVSYSISLQVSMFFSSHSDLAQSSTPGVYAFGNYHQISRIISGNSFTKKVCASALTIRQGEIFHYILLFHFCHTKSDRRVFPTQLISIERKAAPALSWRATLLHNNSFFSPQHRGWSERNGSPFPRFRCKPKNEFYFLPTCIHLFSLIFNLCLFQHTNNMHLLSAGPACARLGVHKI